MVKTQAKEDDDDTKEPNDIVDGKGSDATLRNKYNWIDNLKLEYIIEVYYESGNDTVAPCSLPKPYSCSTNSEDIANTYALLSSCKLTAVPIKEGITGGSYVKYVFYTNSGETYTVYIYADMVNINGYYYKISSFNYTFRYSYSSGDKNAPIEFEKEHVNN